MNVQHKIELSNTLSSVENLGVFPEIFSANSELLKRIEWRNRRIELRLGADGTLFGQIVSRSKISFIPSHQIYEIPKQVLANQRFLREYVEHSYLIPVPIIGNQGKTFSIRALLPLKGGGSGSSKQAKAIEEAESLCQRASQTTSRREKIRLYQLAIQKLERMLREDSIEEFKTRIEEMLGETHFDSALRKIEDNQFQEALLNLQSALGYSSEKAKVSQKIHEVRLAIFQERFSDVREVHEKAKSYEDLKRYPLAISNYKDAIKVLKELEKEFELPEVLQELSAVLKESIEGLGRTFYKNGQFQEAIAALKQAHDEHRSDEATTLLVRIHRQLADQANNVASKIQHLSNALDLGDENARDVLRQLADRTEQELRQQQLDTISQSEPTELRKLSVIIPWQPAAQLGKGVALTGQITQLAIKSMKITHHVERDPPYGSVEKSSFEYFIYGPEDLRTLKDKLVYPSLDRNWHLRIIAKQVETHYLDHQYLYCFLGSYLLSNSRAQLEGGKLTETALRFLQSEGVNAFNDLYGTHFIRGGSKGALFLACLKIKVDSPLDAIAVQEKIRGSARRIHKEGSSRLTKKLEEKIEVIYVTTEGANNSLDCRISKLSELKDIYTNFQSTFSASHFFEAICEPWTSLETFNPHLAETPELDSLCTVLTHCQERLLTNESTRTLCNLFIPLTCATSADQGISEGNADLEQTFHQFMRSDKKVLVLLGEAGSGKSCFLQYLEREFWEKFNPSDDESIIPIRIELSRMLNPVTQAVSEHLSRQGFTENQILEIRTKKKVFIILDGYDEGRHQGSCLHQNLLTTNNLGDWNGKVVIAGRLNASEALNPSHSDHLRRFSPTIEGRIREDLVDELLICPLNVEQVISYTNNFVKQAAPELRRRYQKWFANEGEMFHRFINIVPGLKELVRNPFILSAAVEALPKLVANLEASQSPAQKVLTSGISELDSTRIDAAFQSIPDPVERARIMGQMLQSGHLTGSEVLATLTTQLPQLMSNPSLIGQAQALISSTNSNLDISTNLKKDIYRSFIESCFEREEVKRMNRGDETPELFRGKRASVLAMQFCKDLAQKMEEKQITSIIYIEEDEAVQVEWGRFFGDDTDVEYLREISSDIIRKNIVRGQGQFRYQYTFAHDELRYYFRDL